MRPSSSGAIPQPVSDTRTCVAPATANVLAKAAHGMADDLFEAVTSGKVKIRIDQTYALADIAQAHRDLEARKTTGCTITVDGGVKDAFPR